MGSPRHAGHRPGPGAPRQLPPPGWYMNGPVMRWWDGQAWTQHTAPPPPVYPYPGQQRWAAVGMSGPEHGVNCLATVMTCGLWLPIWAIARIMRGRRRYVPR